jgi:hypothetical protein
MQTCITDGWSSCPSEESILVNKVFLVRSNCTRELAIISANTHGCSYSEIVLEKPNSALQTSGSHSALFTSLLGGVDLKHGKHTCTLIDLTMGWKRQELYWRQNGRSFRLYSTNHLGYKDIVGWWGYTEKVLHGVEESEPLRVVWVGCKCVYSQHFCLLPPLLSSLPAII